MHSAIEMKKPDGSVERSEPQRIKAYLDAEVEPPFPELTDYQGLIWQAFLDVGPSMSGAMGEVPVSWAEVDAFARNSPELSEAWEAEILVRMSQEYLSEKAKGAEALTMEPMERGE